MFQNAGGAQVLMSVSQMSFSTNINDARFIMDGGLGKVGDVTTYPARDINPNMLLWSYNATWQRAVYLKMEPQTWIRYSTKQDYLTSVSNRVTVSIDNNISSYPREVVQSYPFKLYYSVIVHAFGSQETGFRFNGLDGLQDVYANLVHPLVLSGSTWRLVMRRVGLILGEQILKNYLCRPD